MRLKALRQTLVAILILTALSTGRLASAQTPALTTPAQAVRNTASDGDATFTSSSPGASGTYDSLGEITDWEVHNSVTNAYVGSNSTQNPDQPMERWLTRLTPHPYLYAGPSLMGGGYATFAYRVEGGLNVESPQWVMKALAAYDNGRKVNDDDQPNPNGHDRYLDGGIYYRLTSLPSRLSFLGAGHWFLGGGYRWNQLSTTNYTKGVNGPLIGGGYDLVTRACESCRRNFSARFGLDWITAGNDWQNGSHGPEVTVTIPTPRENRHWFYETRAGVYRFHETVTEPSNIPLTRIQESQKGTDGFENIGVVYRF